METPKIEALIIPQPKTKKEEKEWGNKLTGLYVYCNRCKLHVKDKCGMTAKKLKSCETPESHVFKAMVHIPGSIGKKAYSSFETRDLQQAITELAEFKTALKANNYEKPQEKEIQPETIPYVTPGEIEYSEKPVLLKKCFAKYLEYLNNVDVPEQEQKQRTKGHIDMVERYFAFAYDALAKADFDGKKLEVEKLEIGQINKFMVGKIHEYVIKTLNYKPRTYNKFMSLFNSFYEYFIEELEYNIRNPFSKISYFKIKMRKGKAVDIEEFEKLLHQISIGDPVEVLSTKERKYHNYPYLMEGCELGLLTGRRGEELVMFKWKDIVHNKSGEMIMLESEDLKVNRIQDNIAEEEKDYIPIPITGELQELLYRLGYEKYKGTDHFILAPESTKKRLTIKNDLSKGFTHYWKQMGGTAGIGFKNLRKTYMTALFSLLGDKSIVVGGHSDVETMTNHYVDMEVIAMAAKNLHLRAA